MNDAGPVIPPLTHRPTLAATGVLLCQAFSPVALLTPFATGLLHG